MVVPDDIAEPAITLRDQYFDLKGLSAYSALAVSTLREYLKKSLNPLPAYKLKGKILIRKSEFDKWLENYRIKRPDLNTIADEVLDSLKRK